MPPVELSPERVPGEIEAGALADVGESRSGVALIYLALARQMDNGNHTGSQYSALADKAMKARESAMKDAPRAASALDQLRARREAKAAGA